MEADPVDIAVIGSINQDVVLEVDQLPRPGETVLASSTRMNLGGKGANQAVAAAMSGATVSMLGRIGDDQAGAVLLQELAAAGVETSLVRAAPAATGLAYVTVADGENEIVVAPGANYNWSGHTEDRGAASALRSAAVLVAQLEIPVEVVRWAVGESAGRFVLNAAPAAALPEELLRRADPLVVNEHELAALTGAPTDTVQQVASAHRLLLERGARSVVTTLGPLGAVWNEPGGGRHQQPPPVRVVDTTGAGDAFVGQLAAALAHGRDLASAVALATVAGALSVETKGTHASYRPQAEINAALARLGPPSREL